MLAVFVKNQRVIRCTCNITSLVCYHNFYDIVLIGWGAMFYPGQQNKAMSTSYFESNRKNSLFTTRDENVKDFFGYAVPSRPVPSPLMKRVSIWTKWIWNGFEFFFKTRYGWVDSDIALSHHTSILIIYKIIF